LRITPRVEYIACVKLELPAGRVAVKICGLTNRDDALAAIEAGADFLGFNTWRGSRRFIDLEQHAEWIAKLPRDAARVALLVNASREETTRIARMPFVDALQLHGDEDAAFCAWAASLGRPLIKAIRLRDASSIAGAAGFSTADVLLDAHVPGEYGGTGAQAEIDLVRRFRLEHPALRLWLAGGLRAENVAAAIRAAQPAAVDVSSGVEFVPGRKDSAKMRAFVEAARTAR
jgi:phosphoribosylanthranilate isomerase